MTNKELTDKKIENTEDAVIELKKYFHRCGIMRVEPSWSGVEKIINQLTKTTPSQEDIKREVLEDLMDFERKRLGEPHTYLEILIAKFLTQQSKEVE